MSDFSKLKTKKNGKEYVLNACTQDTEQNITGTKNFSKLTVNSKNAVTSINGISASEDGNVELGNAGVITGKIEWFAFNTPPDGYLVCNGAEVSRETYADLFAVIGTTFGSGDGSTTFNIPDLRDRYIIGANTNALGTQIAEQLPNITGDTGDNSAWVYSTAYAVPSSAIDVYRMHDAGTGGAGTGGIFPGKIIFNASKNNATYTDNGHVYPLSLALLPCIKY